MPKIKNETKQDKTYETIGFRQLMSGNENEREQSLRNRNKVSPSPIPWEFPDHGTGKGNQDGIEPIPRVGQMKSEIKRAKAYKGKRIVHRSPEIFRGSP